MYWKMSVAMKMTQNKVSLSLIDFLTAIKVTSFKSYGYHLKKMLTCLTAFACKAKSFAIACIVVFVLLHLVSIFGLTDRSCICVCVRVCFFS